MEQELIVSGGKRLVGELEIEPSKNAFLPILAASVLCEGEIFLENYVDLSDILCMRKILENLNIHSSLQNGGIYIDAKDVQNNKITHEMTQKIRASIFISGALLSRFRSAVVAFPGGCKIGARPIDLFIKGFRALGVNVVERHGYIYCHGQNMHCGEVFFDFPSVGATESLMMCAVLLDGVTTLKNVAKEPEIADLQNFLNLCGAKISGAGSDQIIVEGVKHLHGASFSVMPDRIVAGTYLLATATVGGDVRLKNFRLKDNESLISLLRQTACKIEIKGDTIRLSASGRHPCIESIQTLPFPYFPTDLQSQMLVLQSVSSGSSIIEENVFENRFAIVPELCKMGAKVSVRGRTACVHGVERLFGADVSATDLRAGAALVIAGMKAEGYSTIHNVHYIDRGYEHIEEKFGLLGAEIRRVDVS